MDSMWVGCYELMICAFLTSYQLQLSKKKAGEGDCSESRERINGAWLILGSAEWPLLAYKS